MEELKSLLKNYVIYKEDKKELYYSIKDKYKSFKPFVRDKLGYELIIRGDFLKLEKLPGKAEDWMGIEEFKEVEEYVMLMLLLVFLEDKGSDEQFLLSNITEGLSSNDIGERYDWTDYFNRRSLIKVLRFAVDKNILIIKDGSEDGFLSDSAREVLFESTGISRYAVRQFQSDIMGLKNSSDLIDDKFMQAETDKGVLRRYRVYRRLLLSPIVYRDEAIEDYEYIKNYRSVIDDDFKKYLGWTLQVHKNGALLVPEDKEYGFYLFPNAKASSDVILHILRELRNEIKEDLIKLNQEDIGTMPKIDFEQLIINVKEKNKHGFSKEYREMTQGKFLEEIFSEMKRYSFIREDKETIIIMPLCGKILGNYPKDYVGGC